MNTPCIAFCARVLARILLVLLFDCSLANASTFHVSPSGSDTPPYDTYAKAARHIADAVALADSGDAVQIGAGSYFVDSTIVFKKSFVTVLGAGIDSTLIVPDTGLVQCFFASGYDYSPDFGFQFSDLTIRQDIPYMYWGSPTYYIWLQGDSDYLATQQSEVRRCRFIGGRIDIQSSNCPIMVEDCTFESSGDVGGFFGIRGAGTGPYTIRNNEFKLRRVDRAIWFHPFAFGPILIEHNTCFGGWQCFFVATYFGMDMKIVNNYVDVGYKALAVSGINIEIRNNLLMGGRDSANQQFSHVSNFDLAAGDDITCEENLWISHHQAGDIDVGGLTISPGPLTFRYNALSVFRAESLGVFVLHDWTVPVDTLGLLRAHPMLAPDSSGQLQRGSPLIDAGNPAHQDADGSRSDIGWLGGPGGSTYSYPELPPSAPDSLIATSAGSENLSLKWRKNTEADLEGYRIYRSNLSGFAPPDAALRATLSHLDSAYMDSRDGASLPLFYKITAIDTSGLESDGSEEAPWVTAGVFDEGDATGTTPTSPTIVRAYPNPFNSTLVIQYSLPDVGVQPASISLQVFNALGQHVQTIFEGDQYPGTHQVEWGARTSGQSIASGAYFVRLFYWGRPGETHKVVLLK